MNEKYKGQYRIQSARAIWHNYDGGVYFVTICTRGRVHYLGKIEREETCARMSLSLIGQCVDSNLKEITSHYPYAEVPLYVIMPNHIHALVIINGDKAQDRAMASRDPLSVVVGGLKSAISRFARQNNLQFGWQERFHDHIVRNQHEWNSIAHYINYNIGEWAKDELYSEQ